MKKNRYVVAKTALAMLAGVAVAVSAQAATYKLATSLAITGPTSDAGVPISQGMEDIVKFTNDNKILGDDKVEIIVRDDEYKTDVTKRNFEDFIAQDIVSYLNYSTGSTLALKKDFDEVKITVFPASFHAGNLADSKYIYLPILSYSGQCIGLGEYVANNHKGGKAKVALFIHPSAFGRGPVDDFKKAVEKGMNLEVVEVTEHGKDLDNAALLKRLQEKGVQYVIIQTVQSPVATLLKDAGRLGLIAKSFGEAGKITFMGAHYTGGADLIALAGADAENFYWTTSYTLTTEPGKAADEQLALAKKYGRDEKTGNSHNYTAGIMQAQIPIEAMRRIKAKGGKITRDSIYEEINTWTGDKAFKPLTTVGPISYSASDREGVDMIQLYRAEKGVFKSVGKPFKPALYGK